jgi:hypothetical protein
MSDNLPTPPGGSGLPATRLSNQELEAVIRRAVELQTADGGGQEGIAEAEVLRIGQELGLAPQHVRRAIAEVRAQPVREGGFLGAFMGAARIRAVRTLRRPAVEVGMFLEKYLLECEYMVVQRRFPDRTRYVRASGVAAAVGRAAARFGQRHASLRFDQMDVGVAADDVETCVVEVSVDLGGQRAGFAAGGTLGGLGAGGAVGTVLAIAVAPPAALVGLPILAGMVWGMRAAYHGVARRAQDDLEAFLDRLEHGELRVPPPQDWRKRLGI